MDELEKQEEINRILNERKGINADLANDINDLSNLLLSQVKNLEFAKIEQSQIRSITRDISKTAAQNYSITLRELGTKRLTKKLSEDEERLLKKLGELQKLKSVELTNDPKLQKEITDNLTAQIAKTEKLIAETRTLKDESQKIEENFGVDAFQGISGLLGKIPGLSKYSNEFAQAANEARIAAAAGKNSVEAFGIGLRAAAKSVLPLLILTTLATSLIQADKSSGQLAENLGLSYNEALDLTVALNDSVMATNNVFLNTKNLVEAQLQLSQVLGTNASLNAKTLESQIELTKMAGYSVEAAGQLAQLSLATGESTQDVASNFLGQVRALNLANNLALNEKQLLESISKTSKGTLATFADQPKALARAAFEARKLGLELSQVEKIADGLLDIESSLTAEFEAEVISGRQLNLERARLFALTNDLAGVSRELSAQGVTQESFSKATRIEQDAIAQAMGMSRDELGEMLIEQNALTAIGVRDADAARKKFEALKAQYGEAYAIKNLGDETYAQQIAAVSVQERFSEITAKFQDAFVNIVGPLLQTLAPALEGLSKILAGIANVAQFLGPILPILSTAIGVATGNPLLIGLGVTGLVGQVGQLVQDGLAPASKGPFTITDSYGGLAVTSKGDSLAVSPNITREGRNSGTMIDYDKLADAIAKGAEKGTSRATVVTNLDGDRVSTRLQPSLAVNTRRYSV